MNKHNDSLLISTAMLSAAWANDRRDVFNLLIPFMKYSIAKKCVSEKKVNIDDVSTYFKKEFGYDDIPQNVITKMLNRLVKERTLKRVDKKNEVKYYLKKNLETFVKEFDKRRDRYKTENNKVMASLIQFFSDNGKNLTADKAIEALLDFFAKKGITVLVNTQKLEMLSKKQNEIDYLVAQFIIKENEKAESNKESSFNQLIEMVKGFFISTTISLQSENDNILSAAFKNVKFYFDTRIILNALGCHTDVAQKSTKELINILEGKVYCFEHNYREVYDVIVAYKKSLNNPKINFQNSTLEKFDDDNYDIEDVERVLSTLTEKIKKIGIEIVTPPAVTTTIQYDEASLEKYLKDNRRDIRENANKVDVDNITATLRSRQGVVSSNIEQSKALFITSSNLFARLVDTFLRKDNVSMGFPICITDVDLSSIAWLKNYSTHKDYPKLKLLENALLTLAPSKLLLSKFQEKLEKLQNEGKITPDLAAIVRIDKFVLTDLVNKTYGDEQNLTDSTVEDIVEKVKKQFSKDADIKFEEYKKQQKLERDEERRKATAKWSAFVNQSGTNAKNMAEKIAKIVIRIIQWAMFIALIISLIYSYNLSKYETLSLATVILLAVNIFSAYELFFDRESLIKRAIIRIGNFFMHRAKEKKRKEISKFVDVDKL